MSVRVIEQKPHDWREVEAQMRETIVARLDRALADLDDLEALCGEREDVGHECRVLAASLRTIRNEDERRAYFLRAIARELEGEAG